MAPTSVAAPKASWMRLHWSATSLEASERMATCRDEGGGWGEVRKRRSDMNEIGGRLGDWVEIVGAHLGDKGDVEDEGSERLLREHACE